MMTSNIIRNHVLQLLSWQDAHVSFDVAIEGIPEQSRGIQPQGLPYSPWQLLEHLRITQKDNLEFCRNPAYQEMPWPEAYWPPSVAPTKPEAWDESIGQFRADLEALKQLATGPEPDLTLEIPHGSGQSYLRELLLVADHNAYHIGQLIVVRRLLGIWT